MKTKTLQITTGLMLIFFCLATMSLFSQIHFEGTYADHQGGLSWNADGTGTEPAAYGHGGQHYYSASPDYDQIDPDPHAALGHFLDGITGFPEFVSVMEENNIEPDWIKIRYTLMSMGDDEEGVDWFPLGSYEYSNYYGAVVTILLQNELMLSMDVPYLNLKQPGNEYDLFFESCFLRPVYAAGNSSETAHLLAQAFLTDLDGQSLLFSCEAEYSGHGINENGRIGGWYNILNGQFIKGSPMLPYMGLNADHEGFLGWNADGTGPEPENDGHGSQYYYGASVDYNDIDPDPNAALAHMVDGSTGFLNLLLQMEYRGYALNDLQLKMGLICLGNDVEGDDWGTDWSNYYNQNFTLLIGQEPIISGMTDTIRLETGFWDWSSESTFSQIKNISLSATDNARKIAHAFMLDLGSHQLQGVNPTITNGTETFNENGRDGSYFEIQEGYLIGKCGAINCIEAGYISGTLEAAKSPYLINGHLAVADGETLTIEPGTKLAFRGPYHITIEGTVNAIGTEEDPITFTHSNPMLKWDGFDADAVNTENDSSIFDRCIFEYGYGYGSGPYSSGGIFAIRDFDKLSVKNSTFRYNVAEIETTYYPGGGAIALWNCSPLFMNCIFHDNYAANFGGAVLVYSYSDPIFSNCLFYDNYTDKDGGAIEYYSNSNGQLINCTFADNYATNWGGALDCYDNSSPTIVNSTFWGNTADGDGRQIYALLNSDPAIYYSDIQGGEEGIGGNYDGVYENNIDEDPVFLNAGDNDYQIDASSPCVDAGNPDVSGFMLPEVDLAGNPRIDVVNEIIDIGAYEWTKPEFIVDNNKTTPGFSIYPNPITHSANIEVELAETGFVEIEIYNLLGEKLKMINQSVLQKGKHTLSFQAVDLTNGFYFIKLQAGTTTTTQKFLKQ